MKSPLHWAERFANDNEVYLEKCEADKLRGKALELLHSSDLTPMADLISQLFPRNLQRENNPHINQEQEEKESRERYEARNLYKHMAKNYPGTVSLKLFHIFQRFSDPPTIRFRSLSILYALLARLRDEFEPLSCPFIALLKPILVSSLFHEKPGPLLKILSRVISLLTSEVFELENGEWNELRDFIISAVDDSDVEKGLLLFQDLPLNVGTAFLSPLLGRVFPVIMTKLASREIDSWVLGFGAAFTFVLLLVGPRGDDLSKHKRKLKGLMLDEIIESVTKSVNLGNDGFVKMGLENLVLLVRDKAACYSIGDCEFLNDFISKITKIEGVGAETKQVAARVLKTLEDRSMVAQFRNLSDSE